MRRAEILDTAKSHVTKDRASKHGGAENSFRTIATYWTIHLRARGIIPDTAHGLDASDVAVMMGLLKVARVSNDASHLDNWVDLAGYAACGGELATEATRSLTEAARRAAVAATTVERRPSAAEQDGVDWVNRDT